MGPAEQRGSLLPSRWSPIELLSHVLHMEQRWIVWGFLGEDVDDVWGDWDIDAPWNPDADGRWQVAADVTAEELATRLREQGRRTTEVLGNHRLDEMAAPGGRFDEAPASLEWICFHIVTEYPRHAGHLDIAVELNGAAD